MLGRVILIVSFFFIGNISALAIELGTDIDRVLERAGEELYRLYGHRRPYYDFRAYKYSVLSSWQAVAYEYIVEQHESGDSICDVAGGVGNLEVALWWHGFTNSTLINISREEIEVCGSLAAAFGVDIRCILADIRQLSLQIGMFDIVCLLGWEVGDLTYTLLRTCSSLVKPGGSFIFSYISEDEAIKEQLIWKWPDNADDLLGRCISDAGIIDLCHQLGLSIVQNRSDRYVGGNPPGLGYPRRIVCSRKVDSPSVLPVGTLSVQERRERIYQSWYP